MDDVVTITLASGGSEEIERSHKHLLDRLALETVSDKSALYEAFFLGKSAGKLAGVEAAQRALKEISP